MHTRQMFQIRTHSDYRLVSRLKPKFHLVCHVKSQHDTTRSTCRAHVFCLCRACEQNGATRSWVVSTQHDTSNVSCRVDRWRDVTGKWNLGLSKQVLY